ncbi:MAG: hypothetical protein ACJAT2_001815 [Bacteriovoracaceae bacterium]|jgi:hypothetical protein
MFMKKKIISYLILLSLISGGVCYLVLNYSYSQGNRVGKLVKLSKKGFLPKTWEGTLDLGSGDRLTWDFSIHDDELAERLVKHSGKMVNLEYRELLFKVFYLTEYDVTAFSLNDKNENDKDLLCRFVKVLRQNKGIVEMIRPMILEHDSKLLEEIRGCQNER